MAVALPSPQLRSRQATPWRPRARRHAQRGSGLPAA